MTSHKLKTLIKQGLYLTLIFAIPYSNADVGMVVLTDVLEEVRIKVSPTGKNQTEIPNAKGKRVNSSEPPLGTVTSTFLNCTNCITVNHTYTKATKLINPFGATLPIEKLGSWSGSRAEIHYRTTNNQIELIKILP